MSIEFEHKRRPAMRKLMGFEIVISWVCGFASLIFYVWLIFISDGWTSKAEKQMNVFGSLSIIAFGFVAPLGVIFRHVADHYFEKHVIDSKGRYLLMPRDKYTGWKVILNIVSALLLAGAAWSFVGLAVYASSFVVRS